MQADSNLKQQIIDEILDKGFSEVRVFSIFNSIFKELKQKKSSKHIPLFKKLENNTICITSYQLPGEDPSVSPEYGKIAPFASADHYGDAVNRLKECRGKISALLSVYPKEIRIFCNSKLPEKLFALLADLGKAGKNQLIITKKTGTSCILAGFILPGIYAEKNKPLDFSNKTCGSCDKCSAACPADALTEKGGFFEERCIQNFTTNYRVLSEKEMIQLGNKIYGCQECQNCCPFNQKQNLSTLKTNKGFIGQNIQIESVLSAYLSGQNIKQYFKPSILSSSWMEAKTFVRNAVIAAGNNKSLINLPLIKQLIHDSDPVISKTAVWAVSKYS